MSLFRRRIKVTKEELAEVLASWIARRIDKEQIKETAELFDIDIDNPKEYPAFVNELFNLNMWIVVFSCERVFTDVDKRDDGLDVFHQLLFGRLTRSKELNYKSWMLNLYQKYMGYKKAIGEKQPIWELTKLVNVNIFGEVKKDPFFQMSVGSYFTSVSDALEKALKQYQLS